MNSYWNDNGTYSVQVCGDWTVNTAAEHLQKIALQSLSISERAMHFIKSNPEGRIVTKIDLNGIASIDDSGFSILALWMRHLEKHRFYPVVFHEDAALASRLNHDFVCGSLFI
ncbi:MAG: hypothetical protein H7Y05_09980 [Steroidobacteraceae bacterium]|nr:hypothetical protein [Deltaproteobacteria bacterium]